jgi:hypothetical protein
VRRGVAVDGARLLGVGPLTSSCRDVTAGACGPRR